MIAASTTATDFAPAAAPIVPPAAAATGRGAGAGAAAERREHGRSRERGREGCEVRTALADRGLEVAARLAMAQVGADAPAAQAAPVRG